MRSHYLSSLFLPKSIAMFGASDRANSVGQAVFENLMNGGFKGEIYPINPKHKKINDIKCYADLAALDKPVEMAVVTTPAKTVLPIMRQCGEHGVKHVVLFASGFREAGDAGIALEQKVMEVAQSYGIRILGPNSSGFIRPKVGLNISCGFSLSKPGNVAIVSQSGAICSAMLDWADSNDIGFSTVVSTGASADLDFGEVLDYLVSDPDTRSILLYIEGLHNSRRFMSGLRAAARIKPVIAIKVGRFYGEVETPMSHTGAMVGSDEVFDEALSRSGVVRISQFTQLFAAARILSSRYRSAGKNLMIISNGAGPGVLAADYAVDKGLKLVEPSEETIKKLAKFLGPHQGRRNPLDLKFGADPNSYPKAIELCLQDENIDGVVAFFTPIATQNSEEIAKSVIALADKYKKPILTSWMGGTQVQSSRELFAKAKIPSYQTPESTIDAYSFLAAYQLSQKLLLQSPSKYSTGHERADVEAPHLIIESALSEKRKSLTAQESMAILQAFSINTVRNAVAYSPEQALVIATSIGFPVAMKVLSPDIAHKSDVMGVVLNIRGAQKVRNVYREIMDNVKIKRPEARIDGVLIEKMHIAPNGRELMIGLKNDSIFGPVISFGSGGTQVEVLRDHAVALPPLNRLLAEKLINRTKVKRLLEEFGHMPAANKEAVINILLRVSAMACELPWIQEMDINPLIVDEHGIVAVDAHIRVAYPKSSNRQYAHMAIHPYPARVVENQQLADGTDIVLRPIRPDDTGLLTTFMDSLSSEAKYFRFMHALHHLSPEMLVRFTQIDYDLEMAVVAVEQEEGRVLGVARFLSNPDNISCEFALVVSDARQNQGLGHRLMSKLIEVAYDKGLSVIEGEVLANNHKMLGLMKSMEFTIVNDPEDMNVKIVSKRIA
ncbi:bifunctional acetate--CoA ligase family protein/GNAT family N-acetyltransferase [Leucothrix pacifica]|uniref:GNAT family N-acetyltransferase n=1 Tax=Leucothrix pacifica TaxID=1247513 RepID=A0A317CAI2_9GAMM|nr:bifunctional acetate--CoA ligase family protein/GNAT family N-acetyltransferase [Leucothrix pacifica]PWQ94343.1 GNAT family N-acetyltransferase [Leucothrix pacifica]